MNECVQEQGYQALHLKRIFNAPIEKVFAAWSDAKQLALWFGPLGFVVVKSEVNLVVGGEYNIVIQSPDGQQIRHFGEYVAVSPPTKLVFTWVLENQACGGSQNQQANTLVSIHFTAVAEGTQIELSHERLPNKEAYDGHSFGWNSSFDALASYIQTQNI